MNNVSHLYYQIIFTSRSSFSSDGLLNVFEYTLDLATKSAFLVNMNGLIGAPCDITLFDFGGASLFYNLGSFDVLFDNGCPEFFLDYWLLHNLMEDRSFGFLMDNLLMRLMEHWLV